MPRESKRDQVLAAAARVVRREGSDALTLDAVAREAGVSKGGLLYHFDSKEALVRGLVEALVRGFEGALAGAEDGQVGGFTRAYLRATAAPAPGERAVTAGLLAAIASGPDLLEPLRARYRAWAARFERDGIDRTDALLVRLATDGLWLAELLTLEPPPPKARAAVIARLEALTHAAASRRRPGAPAPAAAAQRRGKAAASAHANAASRAAITAPRTRAAANARANAAVATPRTPRPAAAPRPAARARAPRAAR